MKNIVILFVCLLSFIRFNVVFAQVPYFAGTVGQSKLYGYTSLKVRPGKNSQETYTTFQYGTSNSVAVGLDLSTSNGTSYMGYVMRAGIKFNKWFGVGGQLTPSFDLSNNYKFSYLTAALYMNGAITNNGKLFWCSNTWLGINKSSSNSISNWEYLGLIVPLKKNHTLTPMIGMIHSWKFDQKVDLALGTYYTLNNWNFYLWSNDICTKYPRIVAGVDFIF